MAQIDDFGRTLLEEAKRFLERAGESTSDSAISASLHASLMLGFCALEAHVNAIVDDFSDRGDLSIHDRGILLEREVRLENGEFKLLKSPKISRLEDRILFLHLRFSGKPLNRSAVWWSQLSEAITLRNQLTHPKDHVAITAKAVGQAIQATINAIDALYQAIYKKPFPAASRGLGSTLTF